MYSKISLELNEVIAKARQIAIELGYHYISTLHFFLADCEISREDSILKFAFKNDEEYLSFKEYHKVHSEGRLDLVNETLPLTIEAEIAIHECEFERKNQQHNLIFPCHLFIAALKNKKSILSESFKHEENIVEKLLKYYSDIDEVVSFKREQENLENSTSFEENKWGKSNFSFLNIFRRIVNKKK